MFIFQASAQPTVLAALSLSQLQALAELEQQQQQTRQQQLRAHLDDAIALHNRYNDSFGDASTDSGNSGSRRVIAMPKVGQVEGHPPASTHTPAAAAATASGPSSRHSSTSLQQVSLPAMPRLPQGQLQQLLAQQQQQLQLDATTARHANTNTQLQPAAVAMHQLTASQQHMLLQHAASALKGAGVQHVPASSPILQPTPHHHHQHQQQQQQHSHSTSSTSSGRAGMHSAAQAAAAAAVQANGTAGVYRAGRLLS
jgi:hypothetical protein